MSTTIGIKLDDQTRERLKAVAIGMERAPHWVVKTALLDYLDKAETNQKERDEDMARWMRYQETGHAIPQERVMAWLDALAAGQDEACPE
jgi:predicted transcriptional regulator